ncbi:hypothetical protein LEP1GSC108_0284 [Leptospira weilii str. UI 13098]|uniref:Uncharacterized protein n=1 Tax=Leptospira weilii str. UI 13098 TaxID=1088542 RepID=M6QIV9_9LEPT|nr:hypothetical protein LEP1GSC108_0284 [Leptospira weilii str. UI 13098]
MMVDVDYSGLVSGIEEKFVSEELRIIRENLNGLIPETFQDFLILANYISQKHDREKNNLGHLYANKNFKSADKIEILLL